LSSPRVVIGIMFVGAPPAFAVTPSISSFTPDSGMVGDSVTISGTGFTGASDVSFNGTSAVAFSVDSDIQITATVPSGATTGAISVTNVDGTGMSSTNFTVVPTPPPVITSFSPHHGPIGAAVLITGSALDHVTSVDFNGTSASFSASATQITTHVPAGAVTGPITVTNEGGSDATNVNFEVVRRPVTSSFSPHKGPVGTIVTLSGTHFRWVTRVWFGQRGAKFAVISDAKLKARVPKGFRDARIRVRNAAGQDVTGLPFHQRKIRIGTTVTLGLHLHLRAAGVVNAQNNTHPCEAGRLVLIQKLVNGSWHTIKKVRTGASGGYNVAIPDKPGTYRAMTIHRKTLRLDCLPDVSATAKHEHAPPKPPPPNCTPGYSPCLVYHGGADYDCAGGSGNGPYYTQPGVVYHVTGSDPYGLDADNDGLGCE
jgi:hypothetical protein